MDGYAARMTVGEIFDEEPLVRQSEYVQPGRLHTAYSFFLLQATKATPALFAQGAGVVAATPPAGPPGRSATTTCRGLPPGSARDDPALTRALMAVLMALRGTIFLYQGEELGLPQAEVPFERLRDPFAIAAYDGTAGRDGRPHPHAVVQYGSPAAGFSSSEYTWLPVDERHRALSVEHQAQDPESLLAFTRRLDRLPRRLPGATTGDPPGSSTRPRGCW